MYDPLTYRYPRTMEQAFGPRAVLTIEEEKMDTIDKIVVIACTVAAVVVVALALMEKMR